MTSNITDAFIFKKLFPSISSEFLRITSWEEGWEDQGIFKKEKLLWITILSSSLKRGWIWTSNCPVKKFFSSRDWFQFLSPLCTSEFSRCQLFLGINYYKIHLWAPSNNCCAKKWQNFSHRNNFNMFWSQLELNTLLLVCPPASFPCLQMLYF